MTAPAFTLSRDVTLSFGKAIAAAIDTGEPLRRFVIVVTPEHAYLARRIVLVSESRRQALYQLARRIERSDPTEGELLVLVIGDSEPVLSTIPVHSKMEAR
jgi:hypothetical protein